MIVKILNFWVKKKTKNYTEIPMFMVLFDYKKFKENGAENSCEVRYHPCFCNDEVLKEKLFDVIDYIRKKYNMDIFTRV